MKALLRWTVLLAFLLLLSGCGTENARVTMTEAASAGGGLKDALLGEADWAELYNPGDTAVTLTGWRLTDKLKEPNRFVFPETVLEPGEYLVVVCDGTAGLREDGVLCTGFSLSKDGEELYLLDERGELVAQLSIPALTKGVSYALGEEGVYGYTGQPTPGGAQGAVAGTLQEALAPASVAGGTLRISEVLPRPESGEPWAEVTNMGTEAILLSSCWLSDDPDTLLKWRLPAVTLAPGERLVISLSGGDTAGTVPEASFSLSKAETALYLSDALGDSVDVLTWDGAIQAGVSVSAEGYSATPTPGEENTGVCEAAMRTLETEDPLHINEVLVRNQYSITDRDGDRSPWVELYNASDKAVNLRDYWLSDDGKTLFLWQLPEETLPPGEYRIVFLSGKESALGELHTSFTLSRGETLYLTCRSQLASEALYLPETLEKNISVGLEKGAAVYYGQPTPGSRNSTAFAAADRVSAYDPEGLYVSEACTAPSRGKEWVELYNGGEGEQSLEGWRITDDPEEEGALLTGTLKPGAYRVLYRGTDYAFGLAAEGDVLLLYDGEGVLRDVFDTGPQRAGLSSGRPVGTASSRVFYTKPTPGSPNAGETCTGWTDTPLFSQTDLYFSDTVTVEITCSTDGAEIYYSTGGYDPLRYGKLYTGPVTLSRSASLRAVAVKKGLVSSAYASASYLKETRHTTPVVCISGNAEALEDLMTLSDASSKPTQDVDIQYYDGEGGQLLTFPASIHAKGRGSIQMDQKSIQINLKGSLGRSSVRGAFFGEEAESFTSLELRNSGQDLYATRMKDALFAGICSEARALTFRSRVVSVYINGKYWGLYDLKEDVNEDFCAAAAGCSPEEITIAEQSKTVYGSTGEYEALCKEILTWDMNDLENYNRLGTLVDIDACMDTLICRLWWGDADCANLVFWKAEGGKWAPLLVDMDWCLPDGDGETDVFPLYMARSPMGLDGSTRRQDIYYVLWRSPLFRAAVLRRMEELGETVFATDRVLAAFDAMEAVLAPEMERHTQRWNGPYSNAAWVRDCHALREGLSIRREVVLRQAAEYLSPA